MRRVRLPQQADLDDKHRKLAPSSRGMNANDPSYLGYWSTEEISTFLKELLDGERTGVTAYAAIGRVADPPVSELILESELAQSAICVLLRKEIAARARAGALRDKKTAVLPDVECSLRRMIEFASRNQARLADMIEEAILNIFDSKLNAKLMYLLLLHRKQVEHLETLRI